MDEISQLSASTFELSQRFANPVANRQFPAFEIAVVDGVGHFKQTSVTESDIKHWMAEDAASPTSATTQNVPQHVQASLKLIRIDRNVDVSLIVSKEAFKQLLDTMQVNPAVLYLMCQDYDGFHEYPTGSQHLRTWFFGTAINATLWTFERIGDRSRTMAIHMQRRRNVFPNFGEVLRTFSRHAHVPQLLTMVVSVNIMMHWFDDINYTELRMIRQIEAATGFGPPGRAVGQINATSLRSGKDSYFSATNFDIDTLTGFSQSANEVAGQLSNKLRHIRMVGTALEKLKADVENITGNPSATPLDPSRWSNESLCILGAAIPTINDRLATYADYLTYLRDRCDRLSVVLFAVLTHQDAAASIALGLASKRDTSSMKTIAIVTMAFLPATFIAALFAVPSLTWNADGVISRRFWIYWAFTIPMTTIVFGVWVGITQRQWLLNRIRSSTKTRA